MQDTILEMLDQVERDHEVSIIFAAESGSRAWGFPSTNADFDVRFVYAHPRDWYLSISEGRDVIELPLDAVLDIKGWDVRKALRLVWKSNTSVMEWLASPIRYRQRQDLLEILESVVPRGFQKHTAARHYLSMAKSNMAKTRGETVRMKPYLYAIRPLLGCRWVIERDSPPPILFDELLENCLDQPDVAAEIRAMIELKTSRQEFDAVDSKPALNRWMAEQFERLSSELPDEREPPEVKSFDQAFREIVERV